MAGHQGNDWCTYLALDPVSGAQEEGAVWHEEHGSQE